MASASILCDSAAAQGAAQLLHRSSSSPSSNPNLPGSLEAGSCSSHQCFAAVDQSKWTLIGHEITDPKGKRFLGQISEEAQVGGLAVSESFREKCPWGWAHCLHTSHNELPGKTQGPAWDERQDLMPLASSASSSLHHHWHLSPLHAIAAQDICHFYQLLQLSCSKLPASVI